MDPVLVLQFWLVGTMLTLTPGADWAYVISSALRAKSAAPSILGLMTGYSLMIIAVAFGVGALVNRHPNILTVMTLAGAGYLIYLGISTLRGPAGTIAASSEPIRGGASMFFRGMALSGINPKGLLFLLAILPQSTTSPSTISPTVQMLLLGALQMVGLIVIYFSVAHLARRLLASSPKASAIVTRVSGSLMLLIGLLILGEKIVEVLSQ